MNGAKKKSGCLGKILKAGGAVVVISVVIALLNDDESSERSATPKATPAPAVTPKAKEAPVTRQTPTKTITGPLKVTRAEYGDKWPFTVDEGEVDCEPGPMAIFRTGGKAYAINGVAQRKYPKIDPIWRDNPTPGMEGLKVNIGPMIDLALKRCK